MSSWHNFRAENHPSRSSKLCLLTKLFFGAQSWKTIDIQIPLEVWCLGYVLGGSSYLLKMSFVPLKKMSRLGGLGKQLYLIYIYIDFLERKLSRRIFRHRLPPNMKKCPLTIHGWKINFRLEAEALLFFRGHASVFGGCNLHNTRSKVTVGEDSCLQATLLRQLEVFNLLVILCRLILRTVRHRAIPFSDLEVEEIQEIINKETEKIETQTTS